MKQSVVKACFGLFLSALFFAGCSGGAGHNPPEEEEEPEKNPRVSFTAIDNAGYGAAAISQSNLDPDAWELAAIDQGETYFAVYKTAAQSVSVTGTDAAKVSEISGGDTINGAPVTVAGAAVGTNPRYAVFKADTSGFDLLFEGGSLSFELEVAEEGALPRSVPVTLTVTPLIVPDSISVFLVERTEGQTGDEEGALTKIDARLAAGEGEREVNNLLDAFQWIDIHTADGGPEYLVRLEKDEAIPRVVLTCLNKAVKIRLRGWKEERKITFGGDTGKYGYYYANFNTPGYYYAEAIINIGALGSYNTLISSGEEASDVSDITLQLEDHITLDGENAVPGSDADSYPRGMAAVYTGRSLVMKPGSKITGFRFPGTYLFSSAYNPIYLYAFGGGGNGGRFVLDGGEISGNRVETGVIYAETGKSIALSLKLFTYVSGRIDDNTAVNTGVPHGNYVCCGGNTTERLIKIRYP